MGSSTISTEQRIAPLLVKRTLTRKSKELRGLALALLLYFIWVLSFVLSTSLIRFDPHEGVFWVSGGPGSLFPIPMPSGGLAVITPANMLDSFIYLVFINHGLWIIWVTLALLYIISPFTVNPNYLRQRIKLANT